MLECFEWIRYSFIEDVELQDSQCPHKHLF